MTEQDYMRPVSERYREGTEFAADTHLDLHRSDPRLLSPEAVRALRLVEEAYVAPAQEKEATLQEQSAQYVGSVGANLTIVRHDHLEAA